MFVLALISSFQGEFVPLAALAASHVQEQDLTSAPLAITQGFFFQEYATLHVLRAILIIRTTRHAPSAPRPTVAAVIWLPLELVQLVTTPHTLFTTEHVQPHVLAIFTRYQAQTQGYVQPATLAV